MFEKIDLWYIECSTGCSCCMDENFDYGYFKNEDEANRQKDEWLKGNGNPLASQYARYGRYYVRKAVGEILPDGRMIVNNYKVCDKDFFGQM